MRIALSAIILLWGATAQAKLEFTKIQAAYGSVGPERESLEYYPSDEILFRYLLTGVNANDKGEVDVDISMRVTDDEGKNLLERTTPTKAIAALGGGCVPGSARATLGEALKPGVYRLSVSAKDNHSGDTASFHRDVTLKGAIFTSVSQRFFLDAEGKVPSGAGGIVGQDLHYRIGVIGFDRSKGRIETHMDLEILDEHGKEILTRPSKATYKNEDSEAVKQISVVNFSGFLGLNRVGNFVLRFNFTDVVSGQNAQFAVRLQVTPGD
jgi:hypothetical protein